MESYSLVQGPPTVIPHLPQGQTFVLPPPPPFTPMLTKTLTDQHFLSSSLHIVSGTGNTPPVCFRQHKWMDPPKILRSHGYGILSNLIQSIYFLHHSPSCLSMVTVMIDHPMKHMSLLDLSNGRF